MVAPKGTSGSRVSAVERVYRHTRTAILMGDYPPGFTLRISQLASVNGTSTIPVREALRLLEAERLVVAEDNRGVRVAQLSTHDLADAYRLRTVLEVEAVRLAVPILSSRDRKQAESLRDDMARLFARGRDADAYDAHRRLHFIVYEKAHSPWLLHVISTLWDHTERYRRLGIQWLQRGEYLASQHDEVIDALFSGDVEVAIRALREHFEEPLRLSDVREK